MSDCQAEGAETIRAYCWASGQIEFGLKVPDGAICFASGQADILRAAVEPAARLSYDNKILLVPGIPEAPEQAAAGDALARWLDWRRAGWEANGLAVIEYH